MVDWKEIYGDLKKGVFAFAHRNIVARDNIPPPLTLMFVRHAQTEAATEATPITGPPLTPLGKQQASRVAHRLAHKRFNHIYTSDLTRAKDTARAILRYHSKTPCSVLRDLREVASHHSQLGMSVTTKANDADTINEQMAMSSFVHSLRRNHEPGERVLVVAHGNITRGLIPLLGGVNPTGSPLFEINNTSVTIVYLWKPAQAVIQLLNCTKHLPKRFIT